MATVNKEQVNVRLLRNSNLELLRIVCMLYIVVHHVLVHSLNRVVICNPDVPYGSTAIVSAIINGFCVIAVNCYVIISGYFSIKFRVTKVFHLYFLCASYGFVLYLFYIYTSGQSVGKTMLFNSVFIISHSPWWFIESYFLLFLLSPILNLAVDNSDKKMHLLILIILTLINIYFGYIWENPINRDGYNVSNFIYIYFIGRYIKKYVDVNEFVSQINSRFYFMLFYVLISIFIGLLAISITFVNKIPFSAKHLWKYNNPMIILSAILFFYLFLTFNMKSRLINWVATSVLPVYLIHESPYIKPYFNTYINLFLDFDFISNNIAAQVFIILMYSVLVVLLCVGFDKLFSSLLYPIEYCLISCGRKIKEKVCTVMNY